MNGIALAQALAGVGQGIKEGIKMSDARKAQQLNEMMVNQTIQKNDMLLAKEKQDSMQKLQIEEMKRLAQYTGLTGDMSKVNDLLAQMRVPFKFSDRAGTNGMVNLVSSTTGETLKTTSLNDAINRFYEPVVGEQYSDYAAEQKRLNEDHVAQVKLKDAKELKRTPPGETASETRRNIASAAASEASAGKSNAEANKERVVTGIIEKTGRYPASGASKATGPIRKIVPFRIPK